MPEPAAALTVVFLRSSVEPTPSADSAVPLALAATTLVSSARAPLLALTAALLMPVGRMSSDCAVMREPAPSAYRPWLTLPVVDTAPPWRKICPPACA
ncbi:hypothetical protein D3C72_1957930 [compost metagenome]